VAADHLLDTELPGGGTLDYREDRVLTAPGHRLSQWRLLDWMKRASISYHSAASLREGYFQSAAKGQEFVIDDDPFASSWACGLLTGASEEHAPCPCQQSSPLPSQEKNDPMSSRALCAIDGGSQRLGEVSHFPSCLRIGTSSNECGREITE